MNKNVEFLIKFLQEETDIRTIFLFTALEKFAAKAVANEKQLLEDMKESFVSGPAYFDACKKFKDMYDEHVKNAPTSYLQKPLDVDGEDAREMVDQNILVYFIKPSDYGADYNAFVVEDIDTEDDDVRFTVRGIDDERFEDVEAWDLSLTSKYTD